MTSRIRSLFLALLFTGALGGCGVELVGGGQHEGEAETLLTDGGTGQSSASVERPGGSRPSLSLVTQLVPPATGTVEADLSVALVTPEGSVEPITGSVTGAEVRIAADDGVRIGLVALDARSYPKVRLTFTRVEAALETGIDLGGGVTLDGLVAVDLGAQPLVVEVPVEVAIREEERTTIIVDLNARTWLPQANPVLRRVPAAAFRSAVAVRVR